MSTKLFCWGIGFGVRAKGGNKVGPSWEDIENTLGKIRVKGGSARLERCSDDLFVDGGLSVVSERGRFHLVLCEEVDGEENFRTIVDSTKSGQIEIGGDYWPRANVTGQFDIVLQAFKEFLDTGSVSKSLLK